MSPRTSRTSRSDDDWRRLIDAVAVSGDLAAVCKQAGVSPATLRRHRKRLGQRSWSDAEWVLAALAAARSALTPAQIIEWIDWRNHVRFSLAEVAALLASHVAAGRVVAVTTTTWQLARPWP
ncbi:MAG: hypothetical protein IT370_25935 [Deltaproteobacteria bacterium]|nr:hypothetical protein [Deltaproteobacteria bacterium]